MELRSKVLACAVGALALMFVVNTGMAGSPAGGEVTPMGTDLDLKGPQPNLIAEKLNPKRRPAPRLLARQLQNELESLDQTMVEVKRLSERLRIHQRMLAKLKSNMSTMGEENQMLQLRLQDAMNKQSQMMQTLSAIMKSMHDTQMAIIRNMK